LRKEKNGKYGGVSTNQRKKTDQTIAEIENLNSREEPDPPPCGQSFQAKAYCGTLFLTAAVYIYNSLTKGANGEDEGNSHIVIEPTPTSTATATPTLTISPTNTPPSTPTNTATSSGTPALTPIYYFPKNPTIVWR
jgi:hypothetical protein